METFNHEGATITFALDCYTLCPVEDGGAVAITEVSDYAITEMRGFLPAEDDGTLYHEYEYTVRIHTDDRRFRVVVDRAKVAEEYGIDEADDAVCEELGDQVAHEYAMWVTGTGYTVRVDRHRPGEDGNIITGVFFDHYPTREEVIEFLREDGAIN